MFLLLLLSIYFINVVSLFENQSLIHFICILLTLYLLRDLPMRIDIKELYYKYAEWVFFFVIIAKLKYYHCLFMRRFHIKLNGWYTLYTHWKTKFIKIIAPRLNKLRMLIGSFYHIDKITLLNEIIEQKKLFYLFYKKNIKYTAILYLV